MEITAVLIEFSAFVEELAQVAADVILPFFRSSFKTTDKSGVNSFDPVTEADRGAEAAMRRLIAKNFPSHGIVGEEYGEERIDAEYIWVLDPIDGTKSFISGLPTWGTLIGLMQNGQPVLGMMAQPFTRERFSGDGKHSQLRMPALNLGDTLPLDWTIRSIRTRRCTAFANATIMTTNPELITNSEDRELYRSIERDARLVRYGGDCYAYCALATGFVDLVIETNLKPHDVVALVPIIEGAGGVISTWNGDNAAKGGRIVASGDPVLHEAALRRLAR
jgi:histidinol phosphatase-like enzyme (inositol monophosphatase family)